MFSISFTTIFKQVEQEIDNTNVEYSIGYNNEDTYCSMSLTDFNISFPSQIVTTRSDSVVQSDNNSHSFQVKDAFYQFFQIYFKS